MVFEFELAACELSQIDLSESSAPANCAYNALRNRLEDFMCRDLATTMFACLEVDPRVFEQFQGTGFKSDTWFQFTREWPMAIHLVPYPSCYLPVCRYHAPAYMLERVTGAVFDRAFVNPRCIGFESSDRPGDMAISVQRWDVAAAVRRDCERFETCTHYIRLQAGGNKDWTLRPDSTNHELHGYIARMVKVFQAQ
jgi:hypothetical protein